MLSVDSAVFEQFHFVAKEDKSVSPLRNETLGISLFVRALVTVIPELFIT